MGGGESKGVFGDALGTLLEKELWSADGSAYELFGLATPDHIRLLKTRFPNNAATLMRKVVARLELVVSQGGRNTSEELQVAVHCLWLLQRIFPLLFEEQSDGFVARVFWSNADPFPPKTKTVAEEAAASGFQPAVAGADPAAGALAASAEASSPPPASHPAPSSSPGPRPLPLPSAEVRSAALEGARRATASACGQVAPGQDGLPPLAVRLMDTLLGLCFLQGFTVTSNVPRAGADGEETVASRAMGSIWEKGLRMETAMPSSAAMDTHRTEVLRTLLVVMSQGLYRPASAPAYNGWLHYLTSPACPNTAPLFFSLINVALGYDPIGWGLPYNHVVFTDSREALVDAALAVLLALADYQPQTYRFRAERAEGGESGAESGSGTGEVAGAAAAAAAASGPPEVTRRAEQPVNVYRKLMAGLRDSADFAFLLSNLSRLLTNPEPPRARAATFPQIAANRTYLPGSAKELACTQELLVLLWKLLEHNRSLLQWVLGAEAENHFVETLGAVLFFMHKGRQEPGQVGTVNVCTFILLLLSGKRDFGVTLNRKYDGHLPLRDLPVFSGNFSDLMVIIFHKLVANSTPRLAPLFDCFLTILVNVSPYLKSLTWAWRALMPLGRRVDCEGEAAFPRRSMIASEKLLAMFVRFSSPRFLYAAQPNHHLVFYLLELLNNVVQYQYDGNPHLVYSIVRRRDAFERLARLPLPSEHFANLGSGGAHPSAGDGGAEGGDAQAAAEVGDDSAEAASAEAGGNGGGDAQAVGTCAEVAGGVAPWRPTDEWAQGWKDKLPIQTMLRLLEVLLPRVEQFCTERGVSDEAELVAYLRGTTLVGLLPVPHPILIREYQRNVSTVDWFTSFVWGVIYLRSQYPPLFLGTRVLLFRVKRREAAGS